MAAQRLFVYGSLKRRARHHAELGAAPFLGEAQTEPGYALVPVGQYWALVETSHGEAGRGTGPETMSNQQSEWGRGPIHHETVPGELFEVDEALLAHLDEFEGDDYRRAAVWVTSAQTGENLAALAYLKRTR